MTCVQKVQPVPGAETNGHKVRPDLQTKLVSAVIVAVFIGTIAWVGTRVADLSDRMTRVETVVEERFDRLFDKLAEMTRRLDMLESGKR